MGSGDDLICVKVSDRGKWHAHPNPLALITPCGEQVPSGSPQRALGLVDSGERCRAGGCIEARNKAAGRV